MAGSPQRALSVAVAVQVEAANLAAQSAAVAVLKALPELQLMLKDFGSANRDGCARAAFWALMLIMRIPCMLHCYCCWHLLQLQLPRFARLY